MQPRCSSRLYLLDIHEMRVLSYSELGFVLSRCCGNDAVCPRNFLLVLHSQHAREHRGFALHCHRPDAPSRFYRRRYRTTVSATPMAATAASTSRNVLGNSGTCAGDTLRCK